MLIPAAMATLLLAACQQDSTAPIGADASEMPADQIVYELQHTMTENGIRKAELAADTAYLHENQERWDLIGVSASFFDESGRESGHLTSETGEYNSSTGDFIARGNVVLVTQEAEGPREIRTEELYYEMSGDELWSGEPVVITQDGRTTRGTSFRYNATTQTWTISDAQTSGGSGTPEQIQF
ncbi:MAG TPA: LPS export ABC transporter periplasmic protein LptC [Longimicrobiaceae bacterium]|nr:LPS export ABC transporter periplasmic protein LptC [Longimicrobiaceae bacterium]